MHLLWRLPNCFHSSLLSFNIQQNEKGIHDKSTKYKSLKQLKSLEGKKCFQEKNIANL